MLINKPKSVSARFIVLLAVFVIASCVSPVKTLVEGQSLVYGKVELIYNGKKIKNFQGLGDVAGGASLVLLQPDQDKADNITLSGSGEFYWKVGPGDYALVSFQYSAAGARHNINLGAEFTVPDSPSSVYIGDIVVVVKDYRHAVGIADHYEESITRLQKEYPDHPAPTIRNLISVEQNVGNYTAIRGACSAAWGIDCERHQYGVAPLNPEHQTGGYTKINTLTPTFKWRASKRPEVHYDLIVRKSVSCGGLVLFKEGLHGELVVYEEDLSQPSYKLQQRLEPNTNYIWSVRFREGDIVSTWSSTGHFTFFIIGSSWSRGDWFRFCTP